jgi:hypothetical protein
LNPPDTGALGDALDLALSRVVVLRLCDDAVLEARLLNELQDAIETARQLFDGGKIGPV